MSASDHAILRDRVYQPTKKSLLELSTLSKLPTKLSTSQPSHSFVLQVAGCTICGGAHQSGHCISIEEHN